MEELDYLENDLLQLKQQIKNLNAQRKELEQHIMDQTLEILGIKDDPTFFDCSKEELANKIAVLVGQGADLKPMNFVIKEWLKKHKK